MQRGRQTRVRVGSGLPTTDPNSTLWTATLTQNAGLNARIKLPEGIGAGWTASSILRAISVVSADACLWDFWFWGNGGFQSGHPDQDAFIGIYSFAAVGKQIAAAGLYYAYADGLNLFYEDEEAGLTANVATQIGAYLNVTLINRSAGAKTANAWFQVAFALEPTQGQ